MAGIYCHLICLSISHDKNDMAKLILRQPDFWVVAIETLRLRLCLRTYGPYL